MELETSATEVVETETEQEVVEPAESPEEGSNYQEVANPESEEVTDEQSHEDNAKFQEFRHRMEEAERRAEEAERRLAEHEVTQAAREEVYSEYLEILRMKCYNHNQADYTMISQRNVGYLQMFEWYGTAGNKFIYKAVR